MVLSDAKCGTIITSTEKRKITWPVYAILKKQIPGSLKS